jgi:hypothetical protein
VLPVPGVLAHIQRARQLEHARPLQSTRRWIARRSTGVIGCRYGQYET